MFFSKQLEVYDYHSTLLEKEREEFLDEVRSFKILIENEKETMKGCNKETVHNNSDASDACGKSDEYWFDDDADDISLYSRECTGVEERKGIEQVSFDNNMEKDVRKTEDEIDFCAGIGQKDF